MELLIKADADDKEFVQLVSDNIRYHLSNKILEEVKLEMSSIITQEIRAQIRETVREILVDKNFTVGINEKLSLRDYISECLQRTTTCKHWGPTRTKVQEVIERVVENHAVEELQNLLKPELPVAISQMKEKLHELISTTILTAINHG